MTKRSSSSTVSPEPGRFEAATVAVTATGAPRRYGSVFDSGLPLAARPATSAINNPSQRAAAG